MALEKPLGSDLESSREINDAVAAAFPEERIFRIDHYLGKETVQNMLALRFANVMFEPLWNAAHIDHVQITVTETIGLEGRGDYYDGAGALRDMVQNHMLQLLALVAMEPPTEFDPTAVRDEKVKVLRSLRPIGPTSRRRWSSANMHAGAVGGEPVRATPRSSAEAAGHRDLRRDQGPHRQLALAGRALLLAHRQAAARARSEIVIQFKSVPHKIFARAGCKRSANRLVIRLQPEEYDQLQLMAKSPGLDRKGIVCARCRSTCPDRRFAELRRRIAYERLLLDLIEGDQTLFVRRDEVEAQWRWVDPIRAGWAEQDLSPRALCRGQLGPDAAIALIERDGRSWND